MRQRRVAAMSSAWAAREREQRKGKGVRARESEGERQGGAWRSGEASRASRKESGKQEVAGALGRAPCLGPSGEEEDDRGGRR